MEHLPRAMLMPSSDESAITAARQSAPTQQQQLETQASPLQEFISTRSSLQDRWKMSSQWLSKALEAKAKALDDPAGTRDVVVPAQDAGALQDSELEEDELRDAMAEPHAGTDSEGEYAYDDEYVASDGQAAESMSDDECLVEEVTDQVLQQLQDFVMVNESDDDGEQSDSEYVEGGESDNVITYDAERDDWESDGELEDGVLVA
jgi:hypothetical protein